MRKPPLHTVLSFIFMAIAILVAVANRHNYQANQAALAKITDLEARAWQHVEEDKAVNAQAERLLQVLRETDQRLRFRAEEERASIGDACADCFANEDRYFAHCDINPCVTSLEW